VFKTSRRRTVVAALALLLTGASTVRAQEEPPPPLDVGVGLAYMHEQWLDHGMPFGWVLSVQRHVTPLFSLVGEGSGSYAREEPFPAFIPYSMWVHSVIGGPRASIAATPRVTLFAQTLAGWVRRSRTNPGSVVTPANEGEVNTLGVQPGGGLEYRLNRKIALRFQGDYRLLKSTTVTRRNTNETRVMAGFVFGAERKP
jgi:hypothetical protein